MYFCLNTDGTTKLTDKVVDLIGGYTLTQHEGGWDNNGVVTKEVSYSLTFITPYKIRTYKIIDLAEFIKVEHNQEEVWVTEEEITNTIY